jgi:hypothetical protein
MNYKSYLKNHETITIRLRIIKHIIADKIQINDIAFKYSMHRNTVTNIMKLYYSQAWPELKHMLENNINLTSKDIKEYCDFLIQKSRKPLSHSNQANSLEEKQILDWQAKTKVWPKRLVNNLSARWELWNLTLAKVKGVYKRNWLKVQKVRTKNWETRSLYDYEQIWAFDHGHYDTKEIVDAKSLPKHVYDNLANNRNLPIYERNIIFVWCRARFTAYSRWITSTFWLQFLVYVLSHLRYNWVKWHIHMHTDWWSEFFSNSRRKEALWNNLLQELDADIDCYEPTWDIRKNLIERSHRSDDEEFLIAFGEDFKTKDDFMIKAQAYNDYRNKSRIHSWKGINWRTPLQKIIDCWFYNASKILDFRVLYLDSYFYPLQKHLEYFYFQNALQSTPLQKLKTDKKYSVDLVIKYPHLQSYAQNVLNYYHRYVLLVEKGQEIFNIS